MQCGGWCRNRNIEIALMVIHSRRCGFTEWRSSC
jgi:hypothetical protein